MQYDSAVGMSRCLVTGANGFIGAALVAHLQKQSWSVRGAVRQLPNTPGDWVQVGALGQDMDWRHALEGCDVVVHTAGRAHVLRERESAPLAQFRAVNVQGALRLAEQALEMGVKRFVFISSIGVNGALSVGRPFTEQTPPAPHAAYALSKLEAEQALQALLADQAMELVIIRPPLVYAAQAPGNFARLLHLIRRGVPFPFAKVRNARSMLALENLMDFLQRCMTHPAAADQLFLVADGVDMSTREVISHLGDGMQRRIKMLPIPPQLMAVGATLLGRRAMYDQLCGSLQVDISKARDLLGWQPPLVAEKALRQSAQRYLELNP